MALDGIFLHCLKNEIKEEAVGMRVEKVHQPSKEEILLLLRGRNGAKKLLLSARANSPRIHFTSFAPENPKTPPMLCMLLRKHLCNAMITDVRQYELDRVLAIDFLGTNEIGDKVNVTLVIEIMAQHSNIILVDENGKIIDSLKRVDMTKSSVRQVLPSLDYFLPPKQNKINIIEEDISVLVDRVVENKNKYLSSALMSCMQGISPVVSRELAYRSAGDDVYCSQLSDDDIKNLEKLLLKIKEELSNNNLGAYVYKNSENRPTDFSFFEIKQYGTSGESVKKESFSELLDEFYYERDRQERTKQRSNDIYKMLVSAVSRIAKKINLQKAELERCEDKETLRIFAELINANQYRLEKGALFYDIENYYNNNNIVRIKVDPSLTPAMNAQKYYKEYRKAKTAETMLVQLIEENEQELQYVESVLDELTRSETESEINEIRNELAENGYGKNRKNNQKKQSKPIEPLEYETDDGFKVLVGRNNVQNDKLTFRIARNNDMWLHTKDIHGSHVIIVSDNREISDMAIEQASVIAAYHSKARESSQVPVNYTYVKNIKKPTGAKPGKVIYHVYFTLLANPDMDLINRLKK